MVSNRTGIIVQLSRQPSAHESGLWHFLWTDQQGGGEQKRIWSRSGTVSILSPGSSLPAAPGLLTLPAGFESPMRTQLKV